MSQTYPNSILHNQPGAAERVEVVNQLELELDLDTIESELATVNVALGEIKTALEALEIDVDLDLTTLEGDVAAIKTAVEEQGKGVYSFVDVASMGTSYGSAQFSLDCKDGNLFSICIRNTGANAMDFEVRKKVDAAGTITYLHASQLAVAGGTNATIPIEGVAFFGVYEVYLRSASGTTARIEGLVKS